MSPAYAVDQIQGACAGTIQGQPLNCTANSVELASVTVVSIDGVPVTGTPSCIAGTTITALVRLGLEGSGNADAYDLGVFLATDGLDPTIPVGNGGSAQCDVQTVDTQPSPLTQFDPAPDTCGDFDAPGGNTVLNFNVDLLPIDMPCEPGPTGKLSFPFVVTWFNSGANPVCTGAADLGVATRSTCSAENAFEIDVDVYGGIEVTKQTDPEGDLTPFGFTTGSPTSGDLDTLAFSLADNQSQLLGTTGPLADTPTIYTITEDALPVGYGFTDIVCTGGDSVTYNGQSVDVGLTIANPTADCTFNNFKNSTINVIKSTEGGTGAFAIDWAGPTTSGTVNLDTSGTNPDSDTILTSEAGIFSLQELVPAGWALGNAVCVDDIGGGTVGTWDMVDTITGIDLANGDSVTCTFTNQALGTVMLVKNTVGDPTGSFDFVTDVPGLGTNISTANYTGQISASNVPAGTYSIVETVPAGWQLDSATCDDGSPPDALVLTDGETVTCTFVNIKDGVIIVDKVTLPADSPQIFTFTPSWGADFELTDATPPNISGFLSPGIYSVSEAPTTGWALTDVTCTGVPDVVGVPVPVDKDPAAIDLLPGEVVTCRFTNTQDGSIEVVKSLSSSGPADETFGFTSSFNGTFNLIGDGATTGPVPVAPGSGYTVSEDDPTANGWANTGASCGDGSNPLTDIVVSPGEAVVCTFTNAPLGSATIIKDTVGGNGIFGFTGDAPIGPFSLDTTDQFTATTGDMFDYILQDGIYDVTEDNIPPGFALTDIACSDDSLTDIDTATASMDVQLAETVACTFTNTADGTLIIRKETIPDGAELGFEFTGEAAGTIQDYSATAEEIIVSGQPGIYTSTELVPTGWEITDISCIGQVQSDVTYGDSDVSVNLAAGEEVICTFENTLLGSITIEKFTQGGLGAFQFNGDFGSFQLDTNSANPDSTSFTDQLPGTYQVSEVVPSNWTLSDIQCSGDDASTITIGGAGGFDPGDQGVTIDLVDGENIICTFVNDADGSITVTKLTDPAGSTQSFDFTGEITASLTDGQSSTTIKVPAGNYAVSETAVAGWDLTDISCDDDDSTGTGNTANFVVASGEAVNCTFTNTIQRGNIVVVKQTDPAGSPEVFGFTSSYGSPFGLSDGQQNDSGLLLPTSESSTYSVAEDDKTGWDLASAICSDGSVANAIDLSPGETVICTFTNTQRATITLVKNLPNDNGGDAGQDAFQAYLNGNVVDWDAPQEVLPNVVYTASEDTLPGYTASDWFNACAANGEVTPLPGEDLTCEITNDDVAANLTLDKVVLNNNGGTADKTDWLLSAAGPTPISGAGGVGPSAVSAGSYTLTESGGPEGYLASVWNCTGDGTLTGNVLDLPLGGTASCSILNDDIAANLSLVKTVTNASGGTATATDWTLSAAGPTPISGAGGVAPTPVEAGTYILSESTGPDGYTASAWSCTAGVLTGDSLVLALGETSVCTIVNTDSAATLSLVKSVTNDNGGTAIATEWMLTATGPSPISGAGGVAATPVDAGTYVLSEDAGPGGYTPGAWSCTAGELTGDSLVLAVGESAVCTIVNDDIAPLFTLIKNVINDDFGTAVADDFLLTVGGNAVLSGVSNPYQANVALALDETLLTGYEFIDIQGDVKCPAALGGTVTLEPGDDITCTITNDDVPPVINLAKTVASGPTLEVDGTYTMVYTITATNTGGPGAYDVVDTFSPGAGITLDTADAVYMAGSEDSQTGTLGAYSNFVTAEGLGAGMDESWTVTASFTVDPALLDPASSSCDPAAPVINTGFYNYVEGSVTDPDLTDNATCASLPFASLTVVKLVNGGAALPSDFVLTLTGTDGFHDSGVDYVSGDQPAVQVGIAYTLSELADQVPDYTDAGVSCVDDDGNTPVPHPVTLSDGQSVTCTQTNTFGALPPIEILPVPANDWRALLLLTLMMLTAGWYFRPVTMRKF